MKNKLLMLGLLAAMVMGSACHADSGGEGQAGIDSTAVGTGVEPSATDQAETTTAAVDSVEVLLPDSLRNR
jgi:hypothetical protein